MTKEHLTWETNHALTYPSGNDGRKLRYIEDWQYLTLELAEYEVVVWHKPFDINYRIHPLEGEDWKPTSREGREAYFKLRKSEVKVGDPGGPYMINMEMSPAMFDVPDDAETALLGRKLSTSESGSSPEGFAI